MERDRFDRLAIVGERDRKVPQGFVHFGRIGAHRTHSEILFHRLIRLELPIFRGVIFAFKRTLPVGKRLREHVRVACNHCKVHAVDDGEQRCQKDKDHKDRQQSEFLFRFIHL